MVMLDACKSLNNGQSGEMISVLILEGILISEVVPFLGGFYIRSMVTVLLCCPYLGGHPLFGGSVKRGWAKMVLLLANQCVISVQQFAISGHATWLLPTFHTE